MAIRIRRVDNLTVALCAVETDEVPGDLYLDDAAHYALAAKFCRDWQGSLVSWSYPAEWAAMDTQKLRDAREELHQWFVEMGMDKLRQWGEMRLSRKSEATCSRCADSHNGTHVDIPGAGREVMCW